MKTAIITGASAGLGREFVLGARDNFKDIESFWVIARREEKLREYIDRLPGKDVKILAMDLCNEANFDIIADILKANEPDVRLLVNNAGCGYLGNVGEGDWKKQTRMIDLNLRALTAITHLVIPYMSSGSKIINVSSIASFCPNPRMTVYSSTKAFVSSFNRGIADELKSKGISATAVCPGPMNTEFIYKGKIQGNSTTFEILPYCEPKKVVEGAYRAAKLGRTVYTPTAFYKFYRVLAKVLPQSVMINFTRT